VVSFVPGLELDVVKPGFCSFSFSAPLPDVGGAEYNLELDLAHPVVADQCTCKVLATKVEIK
jgi:hypothetical protein